MRSDLRSVPFFRWGKEKNGNANRNTSQIGTHLLMASSPEKNRNASFSNGTHLHRKNWDASIGTLLLMASSLEPRFDSARVRQTITSGSCVDFLLIKKIDALIWRSYLTAWTHQKILTLQCQDLSNQSNKSWRSYLTRLSDGRQDHQHTSLGLKKKWV